MAALHHGAAEGRLTQEEVDERIAAAYAARFRGELGPLVADLPVAPPARPAPAGWVGLWHAVLRQSRATLLGVAPDAATVPTRRQQVLGALAVAVVLLWLAVWVLIGFGVGVMG